MKKTVTGYILTFVLITMLPACFFGKSQGLKKQGLVVVNVLDKEEYDDCHIQGSVNVPFSTLKTFAGEYDTQKTEFVIYCSNYWCRTSEFACKQLVGMGFEKVSAYEGGMAEWHQLGLPVEGVCSKTYLSKKVDPPAHKKNDITVITAQELKQKMISGGIAKW